MLFTCLEIFLARILDVSISTFRTMLMVKKKSIIIPILAFLEVFIWFMAARKALTTEINSILIPVCYSLGYATGTYIGGYLSRKFIKNINTVEIITKKNNQKLINGLRSRGYSLSIIELKKTFDAEDRELIIAGAKSKNINEIVKLIKKLDEHTFIIVRDTRVVHNGYVR